MVLNGGGFSMGGGICTGDSPGNPSSVGVVLLGGNDVAKLEEGSWRLGGGMECDSSRMVQWMGGDE